MRADVLDAIAAALLELPPDRLRRAIWTGNRVGRAVIDRIEAAREVRAQGRPTGFEVEAT